MLLPLPKVKPPESHLQVSPPINITPGIPPGEVSLPGEIVVDAQPPAGVPTPPDTDPAAAPAATPPAPAAPLPAYPKDTSSAIFMVMKTWECENYDGKVLIEHAMKVYGQEAEDPFIAKGLDALPPFAVTMKEDDITLDEFLDVLAQKTGNDWGVDIAQKTLYIYPAKKPLQP